MVPPIAIDDKVISTAHPAVLVVLGAAATAARLARVYVAPLLARLVR